MAFPIFCTNFHPPVDSAAVDQGRVSSTSAPKVATGRAHSEGDVEVLRHPLAEELEHCNSRVRDVICDRVLFNFHHYRVKFILVEQFCILS